jgi:hypothetical protein
MEKPLQNHFARMEVALVEAARFLGGQPFVLSRLSAQFLRGLISTERRTGVHSSCPRPGGIMRTYPFSLTAILALAFAFPSHAAEKPSPAQAAKTKKVWTNDDMDQLRARGLISTFSVAAETTAQAPPAPSEQATFTPKTEDPTWYADQAAILQAELDKRESALREAQVNLAQAAEGITQPGVAMDKGNVGVTPEAGLAILEAQVHEVQSQLDELSDLARQNNIPPGILRG